jgi:hypothetical protein
LFRARAPDRTLHAGWETTGNGFRHNDIKKKKRIQEILQENRFEQKIFKAKNPVSFQRIRPVADP